MSIPAGPVRLLDEGHGLSVRERNGIMIKGLAGASIWSEDLKKNLLPFYRDVLGLTVRIDTPGFVVFGDAEAPSLALGTHSQVHGRNGDASRHMVGLVTDDLAKDWRRLK